MKKILIATIIMTIAFCSCKKIEGDGNVITDTRNINEFFQEVINETAFDVEVVFSNENKVVIIAESNIAQLLSVKVKQKKLIIKKEKSKYRLNNTQPVSITVYMKSNDYMYFSNFGSGEMTIYSPTARKMELENTGSGELTVLSPLSRELKFENSGSGNLYASECESEAIEIISSASGDVDIKGVTGDVKITDSGSGDIDCYNLLAQYVEIHSSGSGLIEAYATDEADVWISGSSEVYVFGTDRIRYHYEYED